MAAHCSTLAWRIPQREGPGGLRSMGSHRVRHDWATSLSLFTLMHRRRKWQPTPVFLPGESQGRGAWWAAVYGVAQSRTRLKRLSSSSSNSSNKEEQKEEVNSEHSQIKGWWDKNKEREMRERPLQPLVSENPRKENVFKTETGWRCQKLLKGQ